MIPLRYGSHALLVECADLDEVAALHAELLRRAEQGALPPVLDLVPAERTVLIDGLDDPASLAADLATWTLPPARTEPGRTVQLAVHYDGPDLDEVADAWGVHRDEVAAIHSAHEYRVAFCGFAPGFAYLTGLPERYHLPRRPTPRPSVPPGYVAVAGPYTGVYPTGSPGGWNLIGATDAQLWDLERDEPALLVPGSNVRFVPSPTAPVPTPTPSPVSATASPPRAAPEADPAIQILRAGALTTIQDLGRPGYAHLGVPRSGALDQAAHRLANRLVGNDPDAATLETTLSGLTLRALAPIVVAVCGAVAPVRVDGRPAPWAAPVELRAGQTLDVGVASRGVRNYVAIAGGVAVPPALGSRSTDLLSGLGGAALGTEQPREPRLRDGDLLPLGAVSRPPQPADTYPVTVTAPAAGGSAIELPIAHGPRPDAFPEAAWRALTTHEYTVTPTSNRIALRLDGPALARTGPDTIPSEGAVLGAIQVPADGRPIIFLADHPPTGGYPVIAVVPPDALGPAAQAPPGTRIRFRAHGI
ncbi:MAG TPA: urea amidolyase family protein [Actinocrinis sp.]|uniref:5-oxoprolinase subunit B/C family protein n=1 Tax=Actinocrinis sp. TaxID=1920516 RepID=UPI002D3DC434|nr:urea amidolyase family protein [Actinocrinis sp.]HZU56094.1 urea amidolyase family protein [Actinocrinis sp.]